MKSNIEFISTLRMSREDWLTYRHTGIGASEVGTILGLDDYTSSLELFYYKIGAKPKFDTEGLMQFMGHEQEPLIAKMWKYWEGDVESMIRNFREGKVIRTCRKVNGFIRNKEFPWLYVSLDRLIPKQKGRGEGTLELKTIGGYESDKWEAGIPPKYVTQVQTQMLVSAFEWGEMALLQDGRRMDVLPFEISDGITQHIVTKTKEFWDKVVEGRKLVNEQYLAAINFNERRVQEINAQLDLLAPEPDGTLAYAEYLSEKYNKPRQTDRRGTEEELETARLQRIYSNQVKEITELKVLQENKLKKAMGEYQVLDFGAEGKVYWSVNSMKSRTFRNRISGQDLSTD